MSVNATPKHVSEGGGCREKKRGKRNNLPVFSKMRIALRRRGRKEGKKKWGHCEKNCS